MGSRLDNAIEKQFGPEKDTERDSTVDFLASALTSFDKVGDGFQVKVSAIWQGKEVTAVIYRKDINLYIKLPEVWYEVTLNEQIIDDASDDDFNNYKAFLEAISTQE